MWPANRDSEAGGISPLSLCVMASEADESRQALCPEGRHASPPSPFRTHVSLLMVSRSSGLRVFLYIH